MILEPEGYTNQNVIVEIKLNKEIQGFTLQYSRDANKWDNYEEGEKILYTENGTIHARLINAVEEEGGTASKSIDTIDREKPKEATITFNKNPISMGETLTATVTQSDKGVSGLDLTNCRYVFTTTGTALGIDTPSQYTGGNFSSETQTLTLNSSELGTYYLHVLSVDKAGNKMESISKAVTIRDTTPPNDAVITFDKSTYNMGESVIATITQSDGQSGVDIANCRWVWTASTTQLGTSDVTKYEGGGFAKESGDKITTTCEDSGTYYLHVLTVDKAGNKKETISLGIKVEKQVKWLVKNGTIVDSSFVLAPNWSGMAFNGAPPEFKGGESWYNVNYNVYWTINSSAKFKKAYATVSNSNGSTRALSRTGMCYGKSIPTEGNQWTPDMSGGFVEFNSWDSSVYNKEVSMNLNEIIGPKYLSIRIFGRAGYGHKGVLSITQLRLET